MKNATNFRKLLGVHSTRAEKAECLPSNRWRWTPLTGVKHKTCSKWINNCVTYLKVYKDATNISRINVCGYEFLAHFFRWKENENVVDKKNAVDKENEKAVD